MVSRIAAEIRRYICELGAEGRLVSMQLEELMANIENDGLLVLRDYIYSNPNLSTNIKETLFTWDDEELLDLNALVRLLGYPGGTTPDLSVSARGYRLLNKIPRLPFPVVENLVATFGELQKIIDASTEELDEVEGIGEVRARTIKDGLRRLREQLLLDRHYYYRP
jgi:diadenylate cyclase